MYVCMRMSVYVCLYVCVYLSIRKVWEIGSGIILHRIRIHGDWLVCLDFKSADLRKLWLRLPVCVNVLVSMMVVWMSPVSLDHIDLVLSCLSLGVRITFNINFFLLFSVCLSSRLFMANNVSVILSNYD